MKDLVMEEVIQANEQSNVKRIMSPEQIEVFIRQSSEAPEGYCVAVTQHNTTSFYGFFDLFEDSDDLRKKNQWRFVPINYQQEYFYEKRAHNQVNIEYSIILEGDTISNLELIRDFSRAS